MKTLNKITLIFTALLTSATQASLQISQAYALETYHANEPSAIFMTLHNQENQPVNLAMVKTQPHVQPALRLELHDMHQGKMHEVLGIEVPAQGQLELKRGGRHIMVFDSPRPLLKGEILPITLFFDNGEKLNTDVKIIAR